MKLKLPLMQDPTLRQAFKSLEAQDQQYQRKQEVAEFPAVILTSANGTRYFLRVNNAGVLFTEPVA